MRLLLVLAPPPYERFVRERGVAAVKAALDTEIAASTWERGARPLLLPPVTHRAELQLNTSTSCADC